jgi:DHA3 family macrolide efflux protein-like MFS transporter
MIKIDPTTGQWKVPFFAIWTGQAFSLLGSMLVQFALVWWLTQQTGSATVLAMATLVALLPGIIIGPFAGALVDRWNRRTVMMVADSSIAVATLLLAYIYWRGAMQPWHVYAIMLFRSFAGTFHWPAMQASTSLMVPKAQLARIAGLNQALNGAMNIISPPLGALLISAFPLYGVLAVDVVTALLAVVPLGFVAVPQPEQSPSPEPVGVRSLWRDVREGFRYIWGWKGLFLVMMMATVLNLLLNPAFSLMPILITQHFQLGALQLGWMDSAWGIGVIAGGLALSAWGGFKRRIFTTMLGVVGMGVGTLLIGFSPANAFGLALGGMALTGLLNPIANGPLHAIVQDLVAPEMQARVFTVIQSLAMLMSPLGLAVAGPLADAFGVQTWFIIGGLSCLAIGIGGFFVPAIVHLEDDHGRPQPVAGGAALVAGMVEPAE